LHPFLKDYENNWPVKVYLKRHFSNQRSYRARIQREADRKGKDKATDNWMDDLFDFGSDAADSNVNNGQDGAEDGQEF